MSKVLTLLGVCCALLVFAGCRTEPAGAQAGPGSGAATQANGLFPEFLAGTWRTDSGRWGLTFNRDGTISSIKHYYITVPINVEEGGVYERLRDDSYGVFALGLCRAEYFTGTRELQVTIVIDSFYVKLPFGEFEGKMHDRLIGPVSRDGKTWNAKWINYGEIYGLGSDDPNEAKPRPLTFTKVD